MMIGNFRAPWGITLNPFVIVQSGRPFNITLGRDINGDTLNTERPALAPVGADCSDTDQYQVHAVRQFQTDVSAG